MNWRGERAEEPEGTAMNSVSIVFNPSPSFKMARRANTLFEAIRAARVGGEDGGVRGTILWPVVSRERSVAGDTLRGHGSWLSVHSLYVLYNIGPEFINGRKLPHLD